MYKTFLSIKYVLYLHHRWNRWAVVAEATYKVPNWPLKLLFRHVKLSFKLYVR